MSFSPWVAAALPPGASCTQLLKRLKPPIPSSCLFLIPVHLLCNGPVLLDHWGTKLQWRRVKGLQNPSISAYTPSCCKNLSHSATCSTTVVQLRPWRRDESSAVLPQSLIYIIITFTLFSHCQFKHTQSNCNNFYCTFCNVHTNCLTIMNQTLKLNVFSLLLRYSHCQKDFCYSKFIDSFHPFFCSNQTFSIRS